MGRLLTIAVTIAALLSAVSPARADDVEVHYPIDPRVPWTIAGVGVASLIGGFALHQVALTDQDRYDQIVSEQCASGCDGLPPQAAALEHRAQTEDRVSLGLLVAGGVVAIAGMVWSEAFNRPTFELVPTRGGASASVSLRF